MLLKRCFPAFIHQTFSSIDPGALYLPNWHIDLIAEYLEAARNAQIRRLIINMPPRSLKSVCISIAWPAWILGHDPRARIIAASYASSLSIKHSLDCRAILISDWYRTLFPNVRLSADQNEKHKFMTSERGFRFATSIGGSTTGEGGNFLIIDDPLSPVQAMNTKRRNFANAWFENTLASRLDDKQKGVIVLVMQRLHAHDLTGYLLAKGDWEHVSLPAIEESRKQYTCGKIDKWREAGELLHAMREGHVLIERAKLELGSAAFAAQYQQKPVSNECAMIKPLWFPRYKTAPLTMARYIQSWDTAIKSGENNDASVCLTFGEDAGKWYLLDVRSFRYEYPDLRRMFYELAAHWKPQAILLEDKSSGQQLIQDAKRETSLPIIPMRPKADKVTRLAAVSAMMEAGRVLLPEQAPWLIDFEAELFAFPQALHDDQVDALAQYLDWMRGVGWEKLRIRKL